MTTTIKKTSQYNINTNLLLNGSSRFELGRMNALDGFWNVPKKENGGNVINRKQHSPHNEWQHGFWTALLYLLRFVYLRSWPCRWRRYQWCRRRNPLHEVVHTLLSSQENHLLFLKWFNRIVKNIWKIYTGFYVRHLLSFLKLPDVTAKWRLFLKGNLPIGGKVKGFCWTVFTRSPSAELCIWSLNGCVEAINFVSISL